MFLLIGEKEAEDWDLCETGRPAQRQQTLRVARGSLSGRELQITPWKFVHSMVRKKTWNFGAKKWLRNKKYYVCLGHIQHEQMWRRKTNGRVTRDSERWVSKLIELESNVNPLGAPPTHVGEDQARPRSWFWPWVFWIRVICNWQSTELMYTHVRIKVWLIYPALISFDVCSSRRSTESSHCCAV